MSSDALHPLRGLSGEPPGWIWVNPRPQGNSLFGVAPLTDRRAWAVGGAASLLNLDDAGRTVTLNNTTNLYQAFIDITFVDPSDGWVLSDATVFHTVDGGATWDDTAVGSMSPRLHKLKVLDTCTVFLSARKGYFYRTTDRGATWQQLGASTLVGNDCDGLDFIDKDHGWLGCTGTLAGSTDGGATWFALSKDPALAGCMRLIFLDGNDGWGSSAGAVSRTRDGGRTWATTKIGAGHIWGLFVTRRGASVHGWAVGDRGQIFVTVDGDTWAPQPSPTSHVLRDVKFLPNLRTGWIVGDKGTILTTVDGGANWIPRKKSAVASEPLVTPHFSGIALTADEKCVYAVGDGGVIIKSSDGGATWRPLPSGVGVNLNSVFVHPTESALGWAVGDAGTALWTDDGGATWNRGVVDAPGLSRVMDVHFLDERYGVAVGHAFTQEGRRYGMIWSTIDGGHHWVPSIHDAIPPQGPPWFPLEPLNGVHFDRAGNGAAVGINGAIYVTKIGGYSWRPSMSIGTHNDLNGVYFRSDGSGGWAVGDRGTILATADLGMHWSVVQTDQVYDLRSVAFREDVVEGLAVGTELKTEIWPGSTMATVLKFDGARWTPQRSRTQFPLARVRYFDTNHAWVAGHEGSILRTANGGEE